MGTMEQLMTTGLDVELEAYFADYFMIEDEAKKQELRDLVDASGLKDPLVMKKIGVFQREKILKPGIYKEFVGLQQKLEAAGGNGQPTVATAPPATTAATNPVAAPVGTAPAASVELTEDQIAAHQFSAEQEAIIKQKLEAEEEKMRKRLLAREGKIRSNMILGKEKRAARLGLKAEDAAKIEAARDKVKANNEQIVVLRADNKAQKEIIDSIRPKRKNKPVSEATKNLRTAKRKLTMATNAADAVAMAAAQALVTQLEAVVAAETPASA